MALQRSISLEKCALSESERDRLDAEIGRLARVTSKFPSPVLSGSVAPLARGRGHVAALALKVAGKTIAAKESAARPAAAFEAAARKIARQLAAHKEKLRHESSFAREGERKRRVLAGAAASAIPSPFRDVDAFRDEVMRHLDALRARAAGVARLDARLKKLVPRLIDIEDLVDETIAEALRRIEERPARSELAAWLDAILDGVALAAADRFADSARGGSRSAGRGDGESARITTPVEFLDAIQLIEHGEWPESPREVAAPAGEDASRPSQERIDFRRAVARAMRRLPRSWRKALALRYFEELAPREIAAEQRVPLATVKWRLRAALRHLHLTVPDDRRG